MNAYKTFRPILSAASAVAALILLAGCSISAVPVDPYALAGMPAPASSAPDYPDRPGWEPDASPRSVPTPASCAGLPSYESVWQERLDAILREPGGVGLGDGH